MHTNHDIQDTVTMEDVADFITSAAWATRSTYQMVMSSMPHQAIFGRDMHFDAPHLADWEKWEIIDIC